MKLEKKYAFAVGGVIALLSICFILSFLLILISHNFNYNKVVDDMKNEALDDCVEMADSCALTIHNFESYCPDVVNGLQNGSLPVLAYDDGENNG